MENRIWYTLFVDQRGFWGEQKVVANLQEKKPVRKRPPESDHHKLSAFILQGLCASAMQVAGVDGDHHLSS
jgi:hypothetical protein